MDTQDVDWKQVAYDMETDVCRLKRQIVELQNEVKYLRDELRKKLNKERWWS